MSIKTVFPFLDWLKNYKQESFKGDLGAGLTVGIMLIPQGIAYAMIAGLPPIYGLYTALIPQVVYVFLGTSRQLAVGPVAMDSLIVASGVATLAKIGSEHFITLAILLAFMTGLLQILFGLFRLGFLVNFLSRPVVSGFTSAAALIIGLSQLKHLSGISIGRSNRIQDLLIDAVTHINEVNFITLAIGIMSIVILVLFKKYFPKIPAALVVVVLGIAVVKLFHLEKLGVDIVGAVPQGLPAFKIPVFDTSAMYEMAPIALTLSFIAFLEAISVAKAVENKHRTYKVIPNQELIALGMGNLIGSFFQTYPGTGGFSRTAVNNQAGAQTPLAALVAVAIVGLTLLFLTPVFYSLPKAVLAAIIMVAVFGLLDFKVPRQLLNYSIRDLVILNATLLITAMVGIKEGVIVGVALSLAMIIYRTTKPHIAILGNVHNTHFYRNVERFQDLKINEKILIMRFDAQLYFANAGYFKDKVFEFASEKGDALKLVIIDGESMNNLDSSALYALKGVLDYFRKKEIDLAFTGLKGPVRDKMAKSGFMDEVGRHYFFMSIQEAVDNYNIEERTGSEEIKFKQYINQINE